MRRTTISEEPVITEIQEAPPRPHSVRMAVVFADNLDPAVPRNGDARRDTGSLQVLSTVFFPFYERRPVLSGLRVHVRRSDRPHV